MSDEGNCLLTGNPGIETPRAAGTDAAGPAVERVLGSAGERRSGGAVCIVTAGIHGNEPGGVRALQRVLARLADVPVRGRFVALSGNRAGLARNVRFVDEDMNRVWAAERVESVRARTLARETSESHEQRDLLVHIDAELAARPARVTHLDLHSTSGAGPPFTVIAGPATSRSAANDLGVPLLLGLDSVIEGTLIEHFGELGHATVLIEGGQNSAPTTVDHHEAAVWVMLVHSGVVDARDVPELDDLRARLSLGARGLPSELEIAYRHTLDPDEPFKMLPGYASFDAVTEGQLLARAGPGYANEVRAPWTGTLLMPRYQGQGLDGFFLARRVG